MQISRLGVVDASEALQHEAFDFSAVPDSLSRLRPLSGGKSLPRITFNEDKRSELNYSSGMSDNPPKTEV